jgi:hypothetical protein
MRIISIALFVLGALLFLLLGPLVGEWLIGVLTGLVFVVVGLIFFRRGK